MTSSMARAMCGCSPYVLSVKCTHDGSFITASLLAPHAGSRSRGHARLHPANPFVPAADRRPFAEDVRLGAADERVSHYSLPGGR
jgi:hypothetical protein